MRRCIRMLIAVDMTRGGSSSSSKFPPATHRSITCGAKISIAFPIADIFPCLSSNFLGGTLSRFNQLLLAQISRFLFFALGSYLWKREGDCRDQSRVAIKNKKNKKERNITFFVPVENNKEKKSHKKKFRASLFPLSSVLISQPFPINTHDQIFYHRQGKGDSSKGDVGRSIQIKPAFRARK